jgi:hypothetical protein
MAKTEAGLSVLEFNEDLPAVIGRAGLEVEGRQPGDVEVFFAD